MSYFFTILFFLILLSCGKAVHNNEKVEEAQEVLTDGTYMALLVPVNGKISSHINGEVKISKYSDEFKVDVKLSSPPPGDLIQGLQTGSKCPKLESDKNQDGYLDSFETRESLGYMLVPFDDNLSSQAEGANQYPSGNYHYTRSTSYYLMLSDLHLYDEVTNDSLVKLPDKELPLERRVIAIYLRKNSLPVSGPDIPVACGVLTRVSVDENTSEDNSWEEEENRPERTPRRRPTPRPRPRPRPQPEPNPNPSDSDRSEGWWERLRERWERFRERWGGGRSL